MVTAAEINECHVLLHELGCENKTPCKPCTSNMFYSWRKEERGMGCWVAHTALVCLEFSRLKPRMLNPIINHGLSWDDVESLAIMHDIGKLSRQYLEGARIQHNVVSSYITLELCKNENEDERDSKPVALAILLHHEAIHWKKLHQQILPRHFANSIITLKEIITLKDKYQLALDNLSAFLSKMKMQAGLKLIEKLKRRDFYLFNQNEINRLLAADKKIRAKALLLYWLLYLADNRAASSRESYKNYWTEHLKKISFTSPSDLAEKILKNHPRPDISLTAITLS